MKVGICGISGRMGRMVLKKLLERGHTLSAGFDRVVVEKLDVEDNIIDLNGLKVTLCDINIKDVKNTDGIIDFSSPEYTLKMVDAAVQCIKPIVIGTTGCTEEEVDKIKKASKIIPVLMAPNMSLGVNLLFKLTEIASKALKNELDIEVFEAHHRLKKDAPSGTAKKLVEIIKNSIPELKNSSEVTGRNGIIGERTDNEIGIMAMRGGDIVGEHTVFFNGIGERIELTHRATNRGVFASGAVTALEYLIDKEPGLYTMYDVLGL